MSSGLRQLSLAPFGEWILPRPMEPRLWNEIAPRDWCTTTAEINFNINKCISTTAPARKRSWHTIFQNKIKNKNISMSASCVVPISFSYKNYFAKASAMRSGYQFTIHSFCMNSNKPSLVSKKNHCTPYPRKGGNCNENQFKQSFKAHLG